MTPLLLLLASETGLSVDDLERIAATAPRRYKTYWIPKRSGGMREIAQPARELKALQRVIVAEVLADLPVHPAANAYRAGKSIRDNAALHAGTGPILKMDFADFFPSIRSEDWERYCEAHGVLSKEDRALSSNLLFRRAKGEKLLKLSIGAPSSPALSNLLMFEFDGIVASEADRRGIRYTRYADDITFSGQRAGMLKDMARVVEHATRTISLPRLRINTEKTTYVTAKWRRVVTGVVLANDGTLSLGHEKKRRISSQIHHATLGHLTSAQLAELAGQLAFANVVEPKFLRRLEQKYGVDAVNRIKRTVAIPARRRPPTEDDR